MVMLPARPLKNHGRLGEPADSEVAEGGAFKYWDPCKSPVGVSPLPGMRAI